MLRPAVLLAFVALGAGPRPHSSDRGRPVILLVHGRGMQGRDTASLRALWRDALDSGAVSVARGLALSDADVRLVWYADVLDPQSSAGCDYASSDPRAQRAAAEDDGLESLVSFVGNVLDGFSSAAADTDSKMQLRSLAADAAFLSDARKRCASEGRLGAAIDRARDDGRPVIVVAHSLGSLVAYDYLSAQRDTMLVRTLVTVGSPLGSPDLRHLLIGGSDDDTLTTLRDVGDWVNVRNDGDPFATSVRTARDVIVRPPADAPDPHELAGYLREPETAKVVIGAWCEAFRGDAPAACRSITRQQ